MEGRIRWGIIGAGNISKAFATGLGLSTTGELYAVASRSLEKAEAFAAQFGRPKAYGSYEDLLADTQVQAVYIATPHPMHAEWAIKAARAGKHILCEKPLTLNWPEAMAVVSAARKHDVFLMEAFMYRCHPQTAKLVELVAAKVVGDVQMIRATFTFRGGANADSRLIRNDLAGGGIMDVGCYPVSMARLVAGAAMGKPFADPIDVKAVGHLGATGVDERSVASLRFEGDIIASLTTGVRMNGDNTATIYCTDGNIHVPSPWMANRDGGQCKIIVNKNGQPAEEIVIEAPQIYAIEADKAAEHIAARQAPSPAMSWDDTLGNMKTLDRWREQVGLVYQMEQPAAVGTVDRQSLAVAGDCRMKYGRVEGVTKPVSRLVMGTMAPNNMPYAAALYDAFFAAGGNCFDTAYVYGGGNSERLLGQWIANRGLRSKVVILGKGAHTPWCTPKDMVIQLDESLGRLQTDYVDIYMMHRDNLDVPIGEWMDALNELKLAGKIHAFGGSNWTLERIEAGNEYAKGKGLTGFSAVSNNFSLARPVAPVWGGCLSNWDTASRAWLARTKIPLMPWTSQASGFFSGRGDPATCTDPTIKRCWSCDDNNARRERAIELASRRGTTPTAVALAYVLCQPFVTFPLIGPRTLAELEDSLLALDVPLTPEELTCLDLI